MLVHLSLLLPKFVWGIIAFWAIAASILISFFWLANAREAERARKLCAEKKCRYYKDYLTKGPADLSHSQYHTALDSYNHWAAWLKSKKSVCADHDAYKLCDLYRRQARIGLEPVPTQEDFVESLSDA